MDTNNLPKTDEEWKQELDPETYRVTREKGTEAPFTGKYVNEHSKGVYKCSNCGLELFSSDTKFDSGTGWPSFDQEIDGSVKRTLDEDGRRTEITCARCDGHLGHVFEGEGFTKKDTRHCVNSLSMRFIPKEELEGEQLRVYNAAE